MIVNFHNIELETSEDSFRPTLISEECALNANFINKKVLDMGCGIGPLAIYFAKKTHIFNNNFESLGVNEINNSVKKSKNMFMNVSKFEKKFNIKLPSIKKEISHESKNFLKYAYKNR